MTRQTQPARTRPRWLTMLMVLLAVPNLVAGGWAVASPRSWFDSFPGWAPELVAAHPPYNDHLAFDAGSGLLASGVIMALAAFWPRAEAGVVAAVGFLAFALPHALWHLANPAAAMADRENLVNVLTLMAAVIGAAVVLAWHWRSATVSPASTGSSPGDPRPTTTDRPTGPSAPAYRGARQP